MYGPNDYISRPNGVRSQQFSTSDLEEDPKSPSQLCEAEQLLLLLPWML